VKRWIHALSGVPWARTTVRIMGERQIAAFERMCEVTGRKPYELASDIILDELWLAGSTPGLKRQARDNRRWRQDRMLGLGD